MCTAISYQTKDHYFGRNLDLERSYHERVVITPRNFVFPTVGTGPFQNHYAMIGMAAVWEDYPLYYEATNEKGLSMAGLNFPGNADYKLPIEEYDNIAPFAFIPWLLGQCADLQEARGALEKLNLVDIHFHEDLPLSPLHWMISGREGSLVVESVSEGLKVYENPIGVLTNNPTFDYHVMNLNNYMALHEGTPENRLHTSGEMHAYSLGMGAMGLPGDFSSASRFVRAAFVKLKSRTGDSEKESVSQFFHILDSVAMPKGCVLVREGEYEYTRYSSCCNTDRGIYYYTTYDNRTITAVPMHAADLDGADLSIFELQ